MKISVNDQANVTIELENDTEIVMMIEIIHRAWPHIKGGFLGAFGNSILKECCPIVEEIYKTVKGVVKE